MGWSNFSLSIGRSFNRSMEKSQEKEPSMQTTMTQTKPAAAPETLNGLNVKAAMDTIQAIKADPSLGRFQFRARNTWINGGENRSMIRDFYGAGQEDTSRSMTFEFTNGEPPVLLGNNEGANPVEFLL